MLTAIKPNHKPRKPWCSQNARAKAVGSPKHQYDKVFVRAPIRCPPAHEAFQTKGRDLWSSVRANHLLIPRAWCTRKDSPAPLSMPCSTALVASPGRPAWCTQTCETGECCRGLKGGLQGGQCRKTPKLTQGEQGEQGSGGINHGLYRAKHHCPWPSEHREERCNGHRQDHCDSFCCQRCAPGSHSAAGAQAGAHTHTQRLGQTAHDHEHQACSVTQG